MEEKRLSDKEERFLLEYMIDLNPAAAYKRTVGKKVSDKVASRTGNDILSRPHVQVALQILKAERNQRLQIDADRVVQEIARISFSDARKLFGKDGTIKRVEDMDSDIAAAISSIECDEIWEGTGKKRRMVGYTRKVRFWDKNTSLTLLAKHLGLLPDRDRRGAAQKIDVNVTVQQQMAKLSQLTDEELDALIEIKSKEREGTLDIQRLLSPRTGTGESTGGEVQARLSDLRQDVLGDDSWSGEGDLELAHGSDLPGTTVHSGESVSGTPEGT